MEHKEKSHILVTGALLLAVIALTVGISYAFFTYMKLGSTENTITTGNLTFVYDEMAASGNGIALVNALPIADSEGKVLVDANQTFTFQILARVQGENVGYEVYAEKQVGSTLPEDKVKLYLTDVDADGTETAIATSMNNDKVRSYQEFADTTLSGVTGKTLYTEVIANGQANYAKKFRLRMWVSEDAITTDETSGEWDYNNQMFSVKVSVQAQGQA